MRTYEIEEWALRAIKRVEENQQNEDSRVELKAVWPDSPERAARRIAGHANALHGEPILWVIGIDEEKGVTGASQNDLADWWSQTQAEFDGPVPTLRDVLIYWKEKTAVALYFETDQVPYVVKNPSHGKEKGGPVQREIPWRDGTATRSATHSDLILLLSPLQRPVLDVEVGKGRGFVNKYPIPQQVDGATSFDQTMHSPPPPTAARYLRVKVINQGRLTARNCKGYLADLQIWQGGDNFRESNYADYMQLVWSHHPGSKSLDLLPGVPHWLDVVTTLEHDNHFFLETNPKTTRYADGFSETTVHRLTIRVFAEDAEPAQAFVFLCWNGQWDNFDVLSEDEWESRFSPDK